MNPRVALATGQIPKFNESYDIIQLGADDLAAAIGLQAIVLDNQPAGERYFMVPKSKEQFRHYLEGHGAILLAAYIGGHHAAQMIIRSPACA
jgi:hypothetical protein